MSSKSLIVPKNTCALARTCGCSRVNARTRTRKFLKMRTRTLENFVQVRTRTHAHSRILFRCARALENFVQVRTRTHAHSIKNFAHVRVFKNYILLVISDHFLRLIFDDLRRRFYDIKIASPFASPFS